MVNFHAVYIEILTYMPRLFKTSNDLFVGRKYGIHNKWSKELKKLVENNSV